jgi:hypothetical protein
VPHAANVQSIDGASVNAANAQQMEVLASAESYPIVVRSSIWHSLQTPFEVN